MLEVKNASSGSPETTAHVVESPVLTARCLQPTGFSEKMDCTAPQKTKDRTESEPAGHELEQNAFISQQLEDAADALSAPAACVAAGQSQTPGPAQRQGSCDGEEKRDQSKEEPPLETKQLQG